MVSRPGRNSLKRETTTVLFKITSDITCGFRTGELKTAEELRAAGCDIEWLARANAIEAVTGPTFAVSSGPVPPEEAAEAVAEASAYIKKCEANLLELRGEAAELRAKLVESEGTAERFKTQLDRVNEEKSEAIQKASDSANDAARLDAELASALERVKTLEGEAESKESRIRELEEAASKRKR